MATTKIENRVWWDTLHKNGRFDLKFMLKTELAPDDIMPSALDKYNDAAKEVQKLIKDAALNNEGFRSIGSKWSMSSTSM